jgi:hypothetical protein
LLLDGDELPGAALIGALPELVADRRVRQYSLPIHWPWPGPDVRLAEEPSDSDRRLRLLRNDAGPGIRSLQARFGRSGSTDPVPRRVGERFSLLTPEGRGTN